MLSTDCEAIMTSAVYGPSEALREFAAEVAEEAVKTPLGSAAPDKTEVEALLTRFTSFAAAAPADQGYERILVNKSDNWIPASGRSLKPGNLRFNLGTLLEAIAGGVSLGFAAVTVPIVAVFTGILAMRQLVRATEVELSEREALVIWAVWSSEQSGTPTTTDEIQQSCLREAARVGSTLRLTAGEVLHSLEQLEKIGAIRPIEEDAWETREAVVVRT
jgi:hypothetical protein